MAVIEPLHGWFIVKTDTPMQAEQLEILDFLKRHPPFADLPDEALHIAVQAVDVRYYKAGTPIIAFGEDATHWHIVRSGGVEVWLDAAWRRRVAFVFLFPASIANVLAKR